MPVRFMYHQTPTGRGHHVWVWQDWSGAKGQLTIDATSAPTLVQVWSADGYPLGTGLPRETILRDFIASGELYSIKL